MDKKVMVLFILFKTVLEMWAYTRQKEKKIQNAVAGDV